MRAELQERVYSLIRKADQTDDSVHAANFAHAAKEVAEAYQIIEGLTEYRVTLTGNKPEVGE